jgi:hypothetical protein
MLHSFRLPLCLFIACTLLPLVARGQYGQKPPGPKAENLNTSGTIKGLRPGLLLVASETGEQWLVQLRTRPADLAFTGAAELAFLKPGMLVQFTGKFNKRGQCVEPIGSVTIFTVREGYALGVAPEGAGGIEGTKGLFGDAKAEKPVPKKDEIATYRVAGQLAKLSRTGEMTINAGGTSIKADLADNATVSVDVNNLAFAREGDKIELRGQYYPAQKGQAWATWVSISAKEPLAGASPKKKPLPAAQKPAEPAAAEKKPAAAEEAKP